MSKRLVEHCKFVQGLAPVTPSSSTPDYVSLKNYSHCTIVIECKNSTTVGGSAITLKQAASVAGGSEKALSFDTVWANTDTAASDTLTKTTVTSDTFTTDETDNKNLLYVIEIDSSELDVSGGFDCLRLSTGNGTATTLSVTYVLSGAAYPAATPPAAITD